MIVDWQKPGIGLQDLPVTRCLKTWYPSITVVPMRQVISLAGILEWLMVLSDEECVFIGPLTDASGLSTSVFATVGLSTCTSCPNHPPVICDTVETGEQVNTFFCLVIFFLSIKSPFILSLSLEFMEYQRNLGI